MATNTGPEQPALPNPEAAPRTPQTPQTPQTPDRRQVSLEAKKGELGVLFKDKKPENLEEAKKSVIGKFGNFEVAEMQKTELDEAVRQGLVSSGANVLKILKDGQTVGQIVLADKFPSDYTYELHSGADWKFLRIFPFPNTPLEVWWGITQDVNWPSEQGLIGKFGKFEVSKASGETPPAVGNDAMVILKDGVTVGFTTVGQFGRERFGYSFYTADGRFLRIYPIPRTPSEARHVIENDIKW